MAETLPAVSIIIPILDAECFLNRCLSSVAAQSFDNLEIMLLVGKCHDGSLGICLEWQKKDDRIVVVSRKDNSLGDARNYGMSIARGEYIAFVDADDWIEPDYTETMVRPLMNNHDIDLSCCGFSEFRADGTEAFGYMPTVSCETDVDFDKYIRLVRCHMVWNKMYRRRWLLERGLKMFDGCHEDDSFIVMLATECKKIFFVEKALYHYDIDNNDSLIHGRLHYKDYLRSMRYAINYLCERNHYIMARRYIRHISIKTANKYLSENPTDEDFCNEVFEYKKTFFPEAIKEERRDKSLFDTNEAVAIFGLGVDGKDFLTAQHNFFVQYIIDNSKIIQAQNNFRGIPIISLDQYMALAKTIPIIITSSKYGYEIADELWAKGICWYVFSDDICPALGEV